MRLTLNGVAAVITTTLLTVYSLYTLRIEYYALAMALLILILYDMSEAGKAGQAIHRLHAEHVVDQRFVEEQERLRITVRIWNRSAMDIPLLSIMDMPPPYVEPLDKTLFTVSLPRGAGVEASYTVVVRSPGRHAWREIVVEASGPLGFFTVAHVLEAPEHIVALPKKPVLNVLASSIERIAGLRLRGRALQGLYDLATIREYVLGDDARRILWRHYARTGRLYVREDYGETRTRVLVVLDNTVHLWSLGETPNTLAHLVHRLTRGVVEEVLSAGGAVDVALCSDDTARIILDITPQTRHRIIDLYSAVEAGHGCKNGFLVLAEQLGDIIQPSRYTSMVIVTSLYSLAMIEPRHLMSIVSALEKPLPVHVVVAVRSPGEGSEYRPVVEGVERMVENTGGGLSLVHSELFYNPPARGGV